jgi:tetratricopeptide (TPR) repeat protein
MKTILYYKEKAMISKHLLVPLLIGLLGSAVFGQQPGTSGNPSNQLKNDKGYVSLAFLPQGSLPLGKDGDYFSFGGGGDITCQLNLPFYDLLNLQAFTGYDYVPVNAKTGSVAMSVISFGAGVGVDYEIMPKLTIGAFGRGGYSVGFLTGSDGSGGAPFFSAGGNVGYRILPSLSLGLEASYRQFWGLYNDLALSLGVTYHFVSLSAAGAGVPVLEYLDVSKISFDPIFPVLYKFYDDHPIGKALLKNKGSSPIENAIVVLFVKQFMDNPKLCITIDSLKPGEEKEIPLYGLFTDKVLDITESAKVSVNIVIDSKMDGTPYRNENIQTLKLYDRNALMWDDDKKAASFVTMKDPVVLRFSKNIVGMIKDKLNSGINENLLMAMAIHEALTLYGVRYAVDPSSPYAEYSKQKLAVDYLQFPKQTMEYKAGDCDDLSILYTALLESIGIKTAFITIPGHIFTAFSLGMAPENAKRFFYSTDSLVFTKDDTWVPVEITSIGPGFMKAWDIGSREWADAKKEARLYPMHDSWETYEPVELPGKEPDIVMPQQKDVLKSFLAETEKFIKAEFDPKVQALEKKYKNSQDDVRYLNQLGILYAQYGFKDKALASFNTILKTKEYAPALINMGNVYYMDENFEKAREYYLRAYAIAKDDPSVLLSLARVSRELKDANSVDTYYSKLKSVNKTLAEKYAYLGKGSGDTSRAADVTREKEDVSWTE